MAARLVPCPACTRHVKVGPPSCPFCGGEVPTEVAPRPALPTGKPLTRAMLAFAGAAAVSACSSSSLSALYGAVVLPDAGDASSDAAVDTGQPSAHYGGFVMPDAGVDASDAGHGIAAYGVAILPDASDQ